MVPRFRVGSLDHPGIAAAAAIAVALFACSPSGAQSLCAQDPNSGGCDLVLPLVCSRDELVSSAPSELCEITNLQGGSSKRVQVNLKAVSADIRVGGYTVKTENYNGSYLSPVLEVRPGDIAAAKVENALGDPPPPSQPAAGNQHSHAGNPSNLHFFHGGVVTPRNARRANDAGDTAATSGDGDNVYSYLHQGDKPFVYHVPIPTELDARVLDQDGTILHPSGLNWYHSHLHGISSRQVMGGLSGLLSVGDARDNVAACLPDPNDATSCADNPGVTQALKARTDVRYALLRDINLTDIVGLPDATGGPPKTAKWAPDLNRWTSDNGACKVWPADGGAPTDQAAARKGYCQPSQDSAWLFTVNGQRFPTVTVEGGRNLLLRLGNLSANVVYHLELANEQNDSDRQPLLLLSVDGVVPAKPVPADANRQPVKATSVEDLIFMPASRAEIYLRNDCLRPTKQTYVLRTKGLIAGNDTPDSDRWPAIQLMRITFEPSTVDCTDQIALNAALSAIRLAGVAETLGKSVVTKPPGCVDDIDPAKAEHRRVTFSGDLSDDGNRMIWKVLTEIMRPPGAAASPAVLYPQFKPVPEKTVGIKSPTGSFTGIPFENYDLGDGRIDWTNSNGQRPHVCIFADPADPGSESGRQQLWVLKNRTGELHNFHIHQMKFRLATAKELADKFGIDVSNEASQVCSDPPACKGTVYKLYETSTTDENTRWHDTIPMPPGRQVFVVMSFVAEEQIGRYVFHCHILKHEDSGLMAPIEVWKP